MVCSRSLGPKKEHQRLRRQPTSCMRNLKVRDLLLRRRGRRRLALPSPAEIIPGEDERNATRRCTTNGTRGRENGRVADRINARTRRRTDLSITAPRDSLITRASILHTKRAHKSPSDVKNRDKLRRHPKTTEESGKCNLRFARLPETDDVYRHVVFERYRKTAASR